MTQAAGGPSGSAPLPGWLGPIVTITTQVGVPTVIAGVLLWFVLFRLDTALKAIEQAEEDRVRIIATVQDNLVHALDRQAARFEQAIHDNIEANRDLAARYERPPPTARGGQ
jgi:hypothetical protein